MFSALRFFCQILFEIKLILYKYYSIFAQYLFLNSYYITIFAFEYHLLCIIIYCTSDTKCTILIRGYHNYCAI